MPDARFETDPNAPAQLVPASAKEVVEALAYGLSYDERGRPNRSATGRDLVAALAAEHLAGYLERAGFVVMRRVPGQPHTA
ncbi:hypothetical protein EJV46_01360 [Roseococcus sp. SYP-B2431]|uniref:hypothetical protein n=1 Tax=Roseococcus sp. SYP-B2431 TaxID=2496640 RepID=UPI00103D49C0|nr:hypothetical protein [Roseococcus sp. SYP-B2431]TCI00686.1 hypothetical protein EJV46_01360 [Roseococcus sp. SYP-B2431]